MPCSNCTPSDAAPSKSPFRAAALLTGKHDHESVSLAACLFCGDEALYYSTDVYDDFWQYWCLIGYAERAHLLSPDIGEDPERPDRAREIFRKRPTLVKHPLRGFEWAPQGTEVVEGPPW